MIVAQSDEDSSFKSNQIVLVTCAEYNSEMLTYEPLTNSAVTKITDKINGRLRDKSNK
jgi:hypothetical protein